MIKNYIKITFRNLWKNRIYTSTNILGLSIGMACFIGIYAYTSNEINYDRHHPDSDKIFRIKLIGEMSGTAFEAAVCGAPVSEILYNELPEVTLFTRVIQYPRSILFDYKEKKIYQEGIVYADSAFFQMFKYDVLGDSKKALIEPYSLVMLESVATKYFGNEDPIGKIIKWNNTTDYTVNAVIKEPLENSHIGFEVLVSRASLYTNPRYESIYNNMFAFTNLNYIKCTNNNTKDLNPKIAEIFEKHAGAQMKESGADLKIELQAITDIHLKSNITHELKANGNITTVYIFTVVALLIILISSINYVNLAIANSSTRGLEVGVKKIFGANKQSLFIQFLCESIFLIIISFILSILILTLMSPLFDSISNQDFRYILKKNTNWLMLMLFIPLIGLIAGSYPAFYLSSLKPIKILKGKNNSGKQNLLFRNIMIIIQFVISIFLLSCTWLINNQIKYVSNKDLGFEKENLIIMSLRNMDMIDRFPTFKDELLSTAGISNVSASSSYVGSFNQRRGFYRDGYTRKDMMMILNLQCEDNFLQTMNINLESGRYFFPDAEGDRNKIIVNETLVREFGIADPIGKAFRLPSAALESDDQKFEIIGVCKDFHYTSLHQEIKPLIIWKDNSLRRFIAIKINTENHSNTLNLISEKWNEIYSDYPFEYFYLDERFDNLYKADVKIGQVFSVFTVLAIFIACLGVFGLTAFTTEKRSKEIGIRKVLGADVIKILSLISQDYIIPIVISAIISIPISWYFIKSWLQNFSYQVDIQWFVFVFSTLFAFIIALIAINTKAYFAARKNPVDSIRHE